MTLATRKAEAAIVTSKYRNALWTVALVAVAYVIARVGRLVLDWVLASQPAWGADAERIGQWLIGLCVVVVVVVPLLKMYGLIDRDGGAKKR
jgi:hypothetical protein